MVPGRLRDLRVRQGLTQAELADRLAERGWLGGGGGRTGISHAPSLAKIERSKRNVSFEEALALAVALETSPVWLVFAPKGEGGPIALLPDTPVTHEQGRTWFTSALDPRTIFTDRPTGGIVLGGQPPYDVKASSIEDSLMVDPGRVERLARELRDVVDEGDADRITDVLGALQDEVARQRRDVERRQRHERARRTREEQPDG